MKQRQQPFGYHLDLAFADAADPEAILTMNQQMVPCIGMPEAKTNWRAGIDLVRSFLLRDEGEDEFGGPGEAVPALFVDHSCTNTINEFNNYRAPEGSNGRNAPEGDNKSKNHALDALRYGLVHVYHLGCNSHLSDTVSVAPEELIGVSAGLTALGNGPSGSEGFFTSGGGF
jgi:hypothetical protein